MAITNKYDDGQVQSALQDRIIIDETPSEIPDIKLDLRIDNISNTTIDNVDGNIISGSCTLETIDDEDQDYMISANYTLEIDEDGDTISLDYSDCELD